MNPTNRGQVEVQFNWIFILIVGAILLAFFTTIALTQKKAADVQSNVDFFLNFEKAITGISAAEGKQFLLEIPRLDLRYDCTQDCNCGAYVGESRARAITNVFELNSRLIFSPNRLKGDKLLAWSVQWNNPYTITNLLLITSPQVKYLIEDSRKGRELYSQLPPLTILLNGVDEPAIDKQLFNPNDIQNITNIEGNYKVKFVFTDSTPSQIPTILQTLPNSDVTAIKLTETAVIFYEKQDGGTFAEKDTSYVLGDATQPAAIFAEDSIAYGCMMNNAMNTYRQVTNVFSQKQFSYFAESNSENSHLNSCVIDYDPIYLTELSNSLSSFDFLQQNQNVAAISQNVQSIKIQNENAIRDSCPHLY